MPATNSGSRTLRLSWVTRRLRVMRLKANWAGSWSAYCPRFSNHSRLAWAARCVDCDDRLALGLVGGQRLVQGVVLVQAGGEGEGVLHGELGAGADGEVGGVGGVAEEDDVAAAPLLVADGA